MRQRLAFVLHDVNSWGGQERCTFELARRLSHRWPVDIHSFTFDTDSNGSKHRNGWGDVTFHRVRPLVQRPALARSLLFYGATLPELMLSARRARQRALVHTAGACALVSDVVQVHFVHAAYRARFAAERIAGRGALESTYHRTNDYFNFALEAEVFRRSQAFITVSQSVATEVRTYFGQEREVHVVHLGVDSNEFHPPSTDAEHAERKALRAELGLDDDDVAIAFVGLSERKGLATLIRALAALPGPARERAKILAVGGGNADRFRAIAQEHGVGERLITPGPTRGVSRYYRAADLLALPTYYEPFGLVVLEAMASGLPVVVSRCAGVAEVLNGAARSSVTIDDPADAEELAAALAPLISDDRARADAGAAARELAVRRSWDAVGAEYAEVLAPLMERL